MIMMKHCEQKIDLELGDLSVNIDPILIRTFASLASSINKREPVKTNIFIEFVSFKIFLFSRNRKKEKEKKN
jgi:hypothetical protein